MRITKTQNPPVSWDCIIYAEDEPLIFKGGILGDIDLRRYHFLLEAGTTLLQEKGSAKQVENTIRNMLESQELPILSVKQTPGCLWFKVDVSKNPVEGQMQWREVAPTDKETLAWRTIQYPCSHGTKQECLGFAAPAQKDRLSKTQTVASVMSILLTTP